MTQNYDRSQGIIADTCICRQVIDTNIYLMNGHHVVSSFFFMVTGQQRMKQMV